MCSQMIHHCLSPRQPPPPPSLPLSPSLLWTVTKQRWEGGKYEVVWPAPPGSTSKKLLFTVFQWNQKETWAIKYQIIALTADCNFFFKVCYFITSIWTSHNVITSTFSIFFLWGSHNFFFPHQFSLCVLLLQLTECTHTPTHTLTDTQTSADYCDDSNEILAGQFDELLPFTKYLCFFVTHTCCQCVPVKLRTSSAQ